MANGITFDKLEYVRGLMSHGIKQEQAEAHADALDTALKDTVATKHDIEFLRRDILAMEVRLRHDLTLRMGAMIVATVGILAALRFFG